MTLPDYEPLSANDLTTLAVDHGQVPMHIGAVLFFDGQQGPAALGARLAEVPRLRQRLDRPGRGRCGWVADPAFDAARHVRRLPLATPVAQPQVLDAAARLLCTRLDPGHPLWSLRIIDGLDGGGSAAVLVLHHVLADGMGGLALLAGAADAAAGAQDPSNADGHLPQQRPAGPRPVADGARQALAGVRELGIGSRRPRQAARTSLTRPTSMRRELRYLVAALPAVREAAHRHGATVNDVVLTAVGSALFDVLAGRGEHPRELVVSVPISARRQGAQLGNRVGAVPVSLPAAPQERLRAVVAQTARARAGGRGSSSTVLNLLFQGLHRAGTVQWFLDHQRLVHTFQTNLAGPPAPLSLAGDRVRRVVPLAVNPGNVGVCFDVLSYAGELVVTVVADPRQVGAQQVADLVLARLAELAGPGAVGRLCGGTGMG